MDVGVPRNHVPETTSVYSLRRVSAAHRVARHFTVGEFACHDGTPVVLVHAALARFLDRMREHFGVPCKITSGFRTGAWNTKVGGVDNSAHLHGLAGDVVVEDVPPRNVAAWAEDEGAGGVGRYDKFTHVDVWKENRRW